MHSSQFKQLAALHNAYADVILAIVGNTSNHPTNTLENPLFVYIYTYAHSIICVWANTYSYVVAI